MDKTYTKNIPDPGKYPVLPPDMDYIYFDKCEEFPFEPHNLLFSKTNAWWLSECAFLAYTHPGFSRLAFKVAGYDNFRFFQGTGTECMTSWNSEVLIVSFRGTELKSLSTLHELRTDLNTFPTEFLHGGKVHKGFLKALDEIWSGEKGLEQFINSRNKENPQRAIWITGHSLGGALAALCFTMVKEATGLYTFGAPRVGDGEFVRLTKDRPVWRVEHNRDPIPLVPPNLPSIKFVFEDIGRLVYIKDDGEIIFSRPERTKEEYKELVLGTITVQKERRRSLGMDIVEINDHFKESIAEWKRHIKLFKEDTAINITDHMPIYYSTKLWNSLIHTYTN